MEKVCAALILLCALASVVGAQSLPVFYLKYSGGVGQEEIEEDDAGLEPASLRNSVSLRIKEEISPALVTDLTVFYSTKDYHVQAGDYSYFYLKPQVSYDLTDRVTLATELRSKWVFYPDQVDADGESKDYLSLTGGLETIYKPRTGTRITASVKSNFDLYENETRQEQSHAFGLRIQSRLDAVIVGANYRGTFYTPLGAANPDTDALSHEFGASLTWDTNK